MLANIGRALRHRNYRLFFSGQLVSLVGTFLTQAATVWLVYRLTHSAALLGIVGFVGQLPMFLLTAFAGVWADRVNKRNLIVLTQALSSVQSFGLFATAYWFGNDRHMAVPMLLGLAVFQGLINAFDIPARQAFLVEMVSDRNDLANAIALNSTMVHGARLVGPALAGLLIAWVSESICFFIDGVSYLAVIAALLAMTVVPRPARPRRSVAVELREGARYVWTFRPIRVLLMLMGLLSLTAMPALMVLMPIFGAHFGGPKHGAETFGFLGAASGAGALVGALYLASRRTVLGLGRLIAIAATTFGVAVIAFSLSHHLWLSLLIVPIAGGAMFTNFASANTILQTIVEDDKRGRVMAFFAMAFVGMTPFGTLLAGFSAQHLTPANGDQFVGACRTLLIAGAIVVVAGLGFIRKLPGLRVLIAPIYRAKGILPEVAEGLQATDLLTNSGQE
jgi:MFS family permease